MADFRAHFENTSLAYLNGSYLNPARFLDVTRPSAMHGNRPGVTRFTVISRDRGGLPQGLFAGLFIRFGAKNHVAAGNTFGMKPPIPGPGHFDAEIVIVCVCGPDKHGPAAPDLVLMYARFRMLQLVGRTGV